MMYSFTGICRNADENWAIFDAVLQISEVADNGEITGFKMRVEQSKLTTVKALQSIGFETIASGDSYNDLGMIQASRAGFLFRSTDKIKADYPQIPAYETYESRLAGSKRQWMRSK